MFQNNVNQLISRDLDRIKKELISFESEDSIWKTTGEIKNSAGHLTLHLCGNLRHFIGHVLGGTDYVRDRENEFNSSPISRQNLISEIEVTKTEISSVLDNLSNEDLSKIYPINVLKTEMTTQFFLIHLSGHLNYHLGQISYLKKVL